MGRVSEVATYFLRLGTIGFGGPPAHIAAMHDDLVRRRQWIDEPRFLEVVGVTNLIPGPNSTEVAIHVGYLRGGVGGGVVAGLAFMLPAFFMVLAISWAYFETGDFRLREDLLAGIQAVALAAVLGAAWRLRAGVLGGWRKPILGLAGLGLSVAFPALSPVWLLAAGGTNLAAAGVGHRVASVLAVPVAVFAVWDVLAIRAGIWDFNPRYVTGWELPFDLPVEEVAFFVTIPVSSILAYEAVRRTLERRRP
jgi:lycopene cyclase domain-containing protein